MNRYNNIKGITYCLLTSIFWGSGFIVQYIGGLSVGSYIYNALRSIVGVLFLFFMILVRNYLSTKKVYFFEKNENKKDLIKTSFLTGSILASAILIQQIGVENTISAKAGLISSLTVVVVPFLLLIFKNKKIHIFTWFLIIVLVIGFTFLNVGANLSINFGDILCFISTVLFSIDIILLSNKSTYFEPVKLSLFRFIVVFLFSFIFSIVFNNSINYYNIFNSIPIIMYSGVIVVGLGYTMQIYGEKYCEPIIATIIMSLEGLFACIFGFIILKQNLTYLQIIGCFIIIVSNVLIQLNENNVENSI